MYPYGELRFTDSATTLLELYRRMSYFQLVLSNLRFGKCGVYQSVANLFMSHVRPHGCMGVAYRGPLLAHDMGVLIAHVIGKWH